MSKKHEYKTGELARALRVNANTVRSWADTYAALLSSGATANKRSYTPDDALLLATVADMRNSGVSFDAIRDALENGQRVEKMPPIPTSAEREARDAAALVPAAERDALEAQLSQEKEYRQYLENELATMRTERDTLLTRLESETSDIREAWRNEVTELNTRIEALQAELSGERVKTATAEGKLSVLEADRAVQQAAQRSPTFWLIAIGLIIAIVVFAVAAVVVIVGNVAG